MMFHYGQTYGSTSILQTTCSSGISQLEMRFFHDAHSKSSVKMLPYQSAERQNDVYHGRILRQYDLLIQGDPCTDVMEP